MNDEPQRPQPPEIIASGFAGLTDGIRVDMRAMEGRLREDAAQVEERVTARVVAVETGQRDLRTYIESFAGDHAKEHEAEGVERRAAHGTFYEFIRAAELDKARRDGALGLVRFGAELLSKHGKSIAWIIVALGTAAGFATGSIDLAVGR